METFDTNEENTQRMITTISHIFPELKKHDLYNKILFCRLDKKGIPLKVLDILSSRHNLTATNPAILCFLNDYDEDIDTRNGITESIPGAQRYVKFVARTFTNISDCKQSLVFTPRGISYYMKDVDKPPVDKFIEWSEIAQSDIRDLELILYKDTDKNSILFRFLFDAIYRFPIKTRTELIEKTANLINEICVRSEKPEKYFGMIVAAIKDGKYKEAIPMITSFIERFPTSNFAKQAEYYKHWALFYAAETTDTLCVELEAIGEYLRTNFPNFSETDYINHHVSLYGIRSDFYHETGNIIQSFWDANAAMALSKNSDIRSQVVDIFTKRYEIFIDGFSNIPYDERKVICVVDELPPEKPKDFLPLLKDKITEKIKFPPGHPTLGGFYVGHPYKSDIYFPIADYEMELLKNQGRELNNLLQCLGATKIEVHHTKGTSIKSSTFGTKNESRNVNSAVNVETDVGIHSAKASMQDIDSDSNNFTDSKASSELSGKEIFDGGVFTPEFKPYLPDNLTWYYHNETWQEIAEQRLRGGLQKKTIFLSTHNCSILSEESKRLISQEYSHMINGEYNNPVFKLAGRRQEQSHASALTFDKHISNKESEDVWQIIVEFASIETLKDLPKQQGENLPEEIFGTYKILFHSNPYDKVEQFTLSMDRGAITLNSYLNDKNPQWTATIKPQASYFAPISARYKYSKPGKDKKIATGDLDIFLDIKKSRILIYGESTSHKIPHFCYMLKKISSKTTP
mgnify:CR=1 FL=1